MALLRLWLFTARQGGYPEGGTYDTSVLDTVRGTCEDSHQEIRFEDLMNYANARGEQLREVATAQEAFSLCSQAKIPIVPPPATTYDPIKAKPQDIAPSLTPPPIGGSTGGPVQFQAVDSPTNMEISMGTIYRLILVTSPGRVDTGATYPGCSRSNTNQCRPIQFASVDDAVKYAKEHNETPVQVHDVEEVWGIVEGRIPISESAILGGIGLSPMILAAALGAALLLPKLLKKGK